jgi:hypothetical protein
VPTLADVERATAARLGPFYALRATAGAPDTVVVPTLRSTLPIGGYEDLYLLRRQAVQAEDRVAQVVAFDAPTGSLQVDRTYQDSVPATGEDVELHHLHPDDLRRAVRLGLARTWLRDEVALTGAPATGPVDLTALAPWLRLPEQVLEVVVAETLAPVADWDAVHRAGHVFLVRRGSPSNTGLAVWARRAQADYVNGEYVAGGPTADADELLGPLDYLAAAGHAMAWAVDRDRLEAASAEQRMPGQKETALEFTRLSVATCPWLFQPGGRFGGRGQGRVAPLWGLPGAGGVTASSPLTSSWVNGPSGTAPMRSR